MLYNPPRRTNRECLSVLSLFKQLEKSGIFLIRRDLVREAPPSVQEDLKLRCVYICTALIKSANVVALLLERVKSGMKC